ncbi:Nif3-like dinuclear metal center hexameric protein [Egicoccus halophilus]|uniref:GTP cyclohydrolase 1 type 2 homolog n=1 Tax=Egicoccus halophilus TaxID=1670830 RepID=A0A8J3AA27_9ACTN|nr:Nif3-like dinuclear metal center hexameric protein [Egicoccus halophilus]GGI08366.1 GTP cyclohydrolase 1 type 2 [Egicoccus halophilus]
MRETVGDWLALLHERYPPAEAMRWDAVGLQVGDPAWPVARVLVSLDVTGAVVAEAAREPDTLVVAHHPLLFRPLTALTPATASGRTALAAARVGVAVAAAHTNLDVARDGAGTSDPVVRALGLRDVRPLTTELREADELKLVTFVPPEALDRVLDAVTAAGAGRIGDYERCSFRMRGTGTFRPLPGSDPYSGEGVGRDAAEEEWRLEVVLPRRRAGAVVAALHAAHPYEQAAYDLHPLLAGAEVGLGRVGVLQETTSLEALAAIVRERLPAPHLRYAGDPDRPVRTVAVVGGAGDGHLGDALRAGADVYVTGDLRHHVTLDALEQGLALIDAGHHATEVAALPAWIERLSTAADGRGLVAPVIASTTPTTTWR